MLDWCRWVSCLVCTVPLWGQEPAVGEPPYDALCHAGETVPGCGLIEDAERSNQAETSASSLPQTIPARTKATDADVPRIPALPPEAVSSLSEGDATIEATVRPQPRPRVWQGDPELLRNREERLRFSGSVSLTYGVGRGGYESYGGSVVISMEDPENRYRITLGYSRYRGSGRLPVLLPLERSLPPPPSPPLE